MKPFEPNFPVLCISSSGILTSLKTQDSLETTNRDGLASGYFDELLVIDQTGQSFVIKGAREVATVGPLWGWRLFESRVIRVNLDAVSGEQLDLETLKKRVCKAIEQNPELWGAIGQIDEVMESVSELQDILSVIKFFAAEPM